ncbi:MAG: polysaccharide deacetylase family protein, partial [Candidatus Hinthialibacter sp.]
SKDELNNELENSRSELQANLNKKTYYIAYPYGLNNEREREAAKRVGFAAGFKAGPDPFITIHSDLYALPRTTIVQLYTQELVCKKLGLDLSEIRKVISVLDEDEGQFTGDWIPVYFKEHAKCNYTLGQYGKSSAETTDENASWIVKICIAEQGDFSFSMWTPAFLNKNYIQHQKEIRNSFQWTILDGNKKELWTGIVHERKINGWTVFHNVNLPPRNFYLKIDPVFKEEYAFVLDAIKIENSRYW